jgi:hypothetical protein
VFIDRIAFGVDASDRDHYRQHIKIDHNWDKIVLVNPFDPAWAFDLA